MASHLAGFNMISYNLLAIQ